MNDIEYLYSQQSTLKLFEDKWNNLWGEVEQLEELHRLLYNYFDQESVPACREY